MKTFNEAVDAKDLNDVDGIASLNEDRLQRELISYCDTIRKRMEQKDWRKALGETKNLVKILEMVI
jgi:hypothetical protein